MVLYVRPIILNICFLSLYSWMYHYILFRYREKHWTLTKCVPIGTHSVGVQCFSFTFFHVSVFFGLLFCFCCLWISFMFLLYTFFLHTFAQPSLPQYTHSIGEIQAIGYICSMFKAMKT